MARRKETKPRFFFKREHDVHLYYLVLESHVFDDVKDELVCDWRGNIVMRGGWKGVAEKMNARFGTELSYAQVRARMQLLYGKDNRVDELNSLFNEAMNYRDRLDARAFRGKARDWFKPKTAPGAPEET
jgi:hypothetical protein